MRLGGMFWGTVLIVIGGLLALQQMKIISDFWTFVGPVMLILLGVWVLLGVFIPRTLGQISEAIAIDRDNAKKARIELSLGAGEVIINAGAADDKLIVGNSAGPVEIESKMEGDEKVIAIEAGPNFVPFFADSGSPWQFQLSRAAPITLKLEVGASRTELDLTDLQVTNLEIETGASSTTIKMPASCNCFAEISTGASSLDVTVPQGVAARIRFDGGMSSFNVDPRFERKSGSLYQSPDYDTASLRADISIDAGVGSIHIR
jgi:hypothetical protein